MNPTSAAIAAIKVYASSLAGGWAGNTDPQILAAYNGATVNNPAPQGQVPNPIYESALIPLLNDPANGSLAKILNWANYAVLKADIDNGNRVGMLLWAQKLPAIGLITSGEGTNLTAYLNGTQPDPEWPSKVAQSQIDLGRLADEADIAAARAAQ